MMIPPINRNPNRRQRPSLVWATDSRYHYRPCPSCKGSRRCRFCDGTGGNMDDGYQCRHCDGDGKCAACGGTGEA